MTNNLIIADATCPSGLDIIGCAQQAAECVDMQPVRQHRARIGPCGVVGEDYPGNPVAAQQEIVLDITALVKSELYAQEHAHAGFGIVRGELIVVDENNKPVSRGRVMVRVQVEDRDD